jgi:hypothetical protein
LTIIRNSPHYEIHPDPDDVRRRCPLFLPQQQV